MSIYKPCDISGDAAAELSAELYRSWGRALGRRVERPAKFVVGGDVRQSTPKFLAALVEGLCETGLDVVNLGVLPTPMIYYARRRIEAGGCAIVTASHNPAGMNGLKWMIGYRPPTRQQVQQLREEVESGEAAKAVADKPSQSRPLDISFDYVAWLQETFVDSMGARLRVVLDPMHGCFARRARRYLHAIFPQCLFTTIRDDAEAMFGGLSPDCTNPDNLEELATAVYRERAHLGLAFDGDGDRVAVVDDRGAMLTAEEATWLLLESFGEQLRGERFVYDLKFSDRIAEEARRLGAEPVVERSGHTFIRSRMLESEALFGAETSGHYFFGELQGGDDALFATCRLIAFVAATERSVSEMLRGCPRTYTTTDLRLHVDPAQQQQVLDHVEEVFSEHEQTKLDGVRIRFPEGWALVRRSVTEHALTFRFEATDATKLRDLVWHFCEGLPTLGDELLDAFGASLGHGA